MKRDLNLAQNEEEGQINRFSDDDGWRIYEKDGEKFLSVTLILSCVVHEKLKNWFIKNSQNAVKKRSSSTAEIGTNIHTMVETDGKDCPPELEGHLKEWTRLKQLHNIKPIFNEKLVTHPLGFAGQVDLYADTEFGKTVIDIKSGRVTTQAGWQMAAYRLALLASGYPVDAMAVISIPRDGKPAKLFKYEHIDFCTQRFLSAFECFKGLYWSKLDKIGFKQWKEFSPQGFDWR